MPTEPTIDAVRTTSAAPPGDEPSFGELLRFLWARRVRLLRLFLLFAGIGVLGLLLWRVFGRSTVQSTVTLTFRGMARHEYPSGRKFSVEDIRAPEILQKALTTAGVAPDKVDLRGLYAGIEILPVIPSEVQARWKKQDRDGVKREDYLPNEFRMKVSPSGLSNDQRVQLTYGILKTYQGQVMYEQEAALRRVAEFSLLSPTELVKDYDTWDLPTLLRKNTEAFREQLTAVIRESRDFRDSQFGITFRDIQNDLENWTNTRLEALTALTYRDRLVKDRDLMVKRLQERRQEIETQARQAAGEADQLTRLIDTADRPKPLLAGSLSTKEGTPLIDATALERIVKSDYIGPVVRRITDLRQTEKALEAERARIDYELALLSKAGDTAGGRVPSGYEATVSLVTKDLSRIIARYNAAIEKYLQATIQSYVTLREGPALAMDGPSILFLAVGILVSAVILAFLFVLFERSFRGA